MLPNCLMTFISSPGDWIVIGVHLWKQFWERESQLASDGNPVHSILTDYGLDGLSYFIVSAVLGSYLIYFAIGGFIHVKR